MHLCLFTVCESTAIDYRTNRISLFQVLESWESATFPAVIPRLSVVSSFVRKDSDVKELNYRVEAKLGDIILVDGPLEFFFSESPVARSMGEVSGFVVPHPGDVIFSLLNEKNETLAAWCVSVSLIGPGEVEQVSSDNKSKKRV